MRPLAVFVLALIVAAPALAQDVVEPRSGVAFTPRVAEMSLLGVGLRTKTFLKVKVYAIGLYVSDAALAGPLAAHKGKTGTAAFCKDLVFGDFEKQITMKLVRDLSASQIQGAFRETLEKAPKPRVDAFVSYFGDIKAGQEYVLHWAPGGVLETTVGGVAKPPIADKDFAAAVFGIWLGDSPVQDDVEQGLVARAGSLIK